MGCVVLLWSFQDEPVLVEVPEPLLTEFGANHRLENCVEIKMVAGKKVPEPNKDVDFLVENVEWQNAKRVVFLDVARGSEFVKSAFCHPGKHKHHRVYSILLIITIFVHRCQLIVVSY